MPIYDRIRQIIQSPPARQINFTFQNAVVNANLFNRVANALGVADPIRYEGVGVIIDPAMDRNTAASYRPRGNVFVLRDEGLNQLFDEVTIVHEAVHCGFDMERRNNWLWFGNEACAYIAGALFAIYRGISDQTITSWNAEYSIAWDIARQIRPGATVTWDQYLPLRTQLLAAARTPGSAYYGWPDTYCYPNDGPSNYNH